MLDLGTVKPGSTIRIPFSTFDKDDGSSITMTNFAAADILIYKDGSTTERASTSGYTATTDFDTKTGKHLIVIDLADNTTADFFAAGSEYLVAIDAVTVDAVTVGGWVARFRIGYPGAVLDTTIATLSSQTSFTLTAGPAEDDALNGMGAVIHDAASAVQQSWVLISDYTGSTKTVTLAAGATFTVAAKDNISIMYPAPLQPTVIGRTLDVTATGAAGIDWANVEGPTTSVNLSGTTISTSQAIASVSGAVGSVTGAVGSVTGSVGGNVNGNVANVTAVGAGAITSSSFASGAITATAIQTGAFTGAKFATDSITSAALAADAVAEIADAVWDEAISGHLTAGSTGNALNAAGSAGDPWSTGLPGAYGAGSAGYILGTNLNATISSRASQTSLDTLDDYVDTEVAAIKAKTDNLPAAPAATGDIPSAAAIADAVWDESTSGHTTSGTFGEQVKTDVDSILADTNELQTDWTNGGRLDLLLDSTLADTNELQTDWANGGRLDLIVDAILDDTGTSGVLLTSAYDFAKGTVAVTESYNTDGAAPTPVQALMLILQSLTEVSISGTSMTIKKLDGSTTAATLTLNSATTPTSKTRAS